MHPRGAQNQQPGNDHRRHQDGVDRRAKARIEARKPFRDKVVPARGHGQAHHAGEDEAGRTENTDLQQKNRYFADHRAGPAFAKGQAQGLWNRGHVVDFQTGVQFVKAEHGGGA